MRVSISYWFVVVLWSTTPLAIQYSYESFSFIASVTARMVLALLCCVILLVISRQSLVKSKKDWWAFLAGSIALFPNMIIMYWCALHIPSGLIAVILGTYPFMVGVFSWYLLNENIFTASRIAAVMVALAGLIVIFSQQMNVGFEAFLGVLGMTVCSCIYGLSSVWVKRVAGDVDPLRQCTGVLIIAVPQFVLTWFFMDGEIPTDISLKSYLAVFYLAIPGTVLGFSLFYYVIRHCEMQKIALITLLTPVLALLLGAILENEILSIRSMVGSLLVVGSLGLYQGTYKRFWTYLKLRAVRSV